MSIKNYIQTLFLILSFIHQTGFCQKPNLSPSWIVIEEEEIVRYPELSPVNDELIKTLDSVLQIYRISFEESYDSTLYFVLSFNVSADSAIVTIVKNSFTWYNLFQRQYYEYPEDRPFGSFEHSGILFIVENSTEDLINRFFKVKSGVNRITTKSRKLLEPGVFNERQTFRFKYEIVDYSLSLIHGRIESYKFIEED